MVKFGVCGSLDKIMDAQSAGFEYLEPPVSGVAAMTNEEFTEKLAMVKAASIPTPAFNLLFPPTINVYTSSNQEIEDYLDHAMSRIQQLGGRVAVFGSGRSRNRPEGLTYSEAFRRLTDVTRLTGEVAGRYGVTIAIEPLNRTECNMINSVAEGACLAAMVNHPHVKVLADYYHVAKDGEPCSDVVRVCGVTHTHIATKEGRLYPTRIEDGFVDFFKALKATDYDGLMSVEGKSEDMQKDGPVSVALLKKLWEEA